MIMNVNKGNQNLQKSRNQKTPLNSAAGRVLSGDHANNLGPEPKMSSQSQPLFTEGTYVEKDLGLVPPEKDLSVLHMSSSLNIVRC